MLTTKADIRLSKNPATLLVDSWKRFAILQLKIDYITFDRTHDSDKNRPEGPRNLGVDVGPTTGNPYPILDLTENSIPCLDYFRPEPYFILFA